jgi:hypothetical protein
MNDLKDAAAPRSGLTKSLRAAGKADADVMRSFLELPSPFDAAFAAATAM